MKAGAAATCLIAVLGLQWMTALPASASTWSDAGNLNVARRGHTATLLSDGRVLAAGGRSPTVTGDASSELFNPTTRQWTTTGAMAVPRYYHTDSRLANGQVLVAGGLSRSSTNGADFVELSAAELYDPATGLWRSTGALRDPRDSHTATVLPDGRVLVTGGVTSFPLGGLNSAELYDPTAGVWLPANAMASARVNHTATLLPNGKVLVAGGEVDINGAAIATAELYDPATGAWSSTGSLATARKNHTATLLPNGKVLVAGGRRVPISGEPTGTHVFASAELYDPATGTWSPTGALAAARFDHTATVVGSRAVVTGGNGPDALPTAEAYDPASGTWSPSGSLAKPRAEHSATLLSGGTLLVAGGCGAACPLTSSETRLSSDLSVTMTDAPDPAEIGQPLTYTITAQNAGPDPAEGVTLRDQLPAGVEFVSASTGCAQASGVVTCDLGTLAKGATSAQRQITVLPTQASAALANTATVDSVTDDLQGANNAATVTTEVRTAAGPAQCSDGVDNDQDGKTDHPADPGCESPGDVSESPDPLPPSVPTISIDNVTVTEGDSAGTSASFTLTLSAASQSPVSVSYATADDSAVAPGDYSPAGGTAAFAPGEISKTVAVQVNGDVVDEPDERFFVKLSNPQGATLAVDQGVGAITDDDVPAPPAAAVDDVTVTEGDAGEIDATFSVSLSGSSSEFVRVDVKTADDSATAPADYTAATPRLTFSPGETTKTVSVKVQGDRADEPDERFLVNLSNPSGATVGDGQGIATIADDDPAAGGGAGVGGGGGGAAPASPSTTPTAPSPTPGGAAPTPSAGPLPSTTRRLKAQRRARALRRCLARVAKRRGRSARRARRRCQARFGRVPGRVSGLRARGVSKTKVQLSFLTAGSDRRRSPAARVYLVKQALRPIAGARAFRRSRSLCRGACRFSVTRVGARVTLTVTGLRPRTTYYYAVAARAIGSRRLGPSSMARARTR